MTPEELKEWLRHNLEIEVRPASNYGPGNDVRIGLRFAGEDHPFIFEYVTIPEAT